jgi:hypothetical protein
LTHQQRLILRARRHVVEFTGLNDLAIQFELLLCPLEHKLLHRLGRDEPEHSDLFLLTDTMRTEVSAGTYNTVGTDRLPILRLEIRVRVPVRVVERRQQRLTIFRLGGTVETAVFPPAIVKEVRDDGHDLGHLEEDEHLGSGQQRRADILEDRTHLVFHLEHFG